MHKTESDILKAVLVGVQLPGQGDRETQSSLDELARLVTTLGYDPIGRLHQKRSSTKNAVVLGEGKLKELADWTGGTGLVSVSFEKKLSKAAQKFSKNQDEEEVPEVTEPEVDEASQSKPHDKADVAIFDCDLSPS
ncbi:MAG: HflX-like GTP-binding protein, partial [Pseudobdellovibrio sp.]